jgi:hypothetical protein
MNDEERQRLIWLERKVTELLWVAIIACAHSLDGSLPTSLPPTWSLMRLDGFGSLSLLEGGF